jgi:hypothetical protein
MKWFYEHSTILRPWANLQLSFYSLCLVCRLLDNVTWPYLYRSPEVCWLKHVDIWTFTTHLVRALLYNPTLRYLVRNLDRFLLDFVWHVSLSPTLTKYAQVRMARFAFDSKQWEGLLAWK